MTAARVGPLTGSENTTHHLHLGIPPNALRHRVRNEILAIIEEIDISSFLKSPFLPPKVLILLAAACLTWIGLLSLAFVFFTGTAASAGWLFAGALLLALAVWGVAMSWEFRNAVPRQEDLVEDDCNPYPGIGSTPTRPRSRFAGVQANRAITTLRKITPGPRAKTQPRKLGIRRMERTNRYNVR